MQAGDRAHLKALLLEIGHLADAAERCVEHTTYSSPRKESMAKYHRRDEDVAKWLDQIGDAFARLRAMRASIPTLALEVQQRTVTPERK